MLHVKKFLLDIIQLVFLLPVVLIPGDKLVTTSQESFEEPNSQNGRFCFFIRCTSSVFWIGYVWCKLWCKVTCTSMIISVCKTSPLCINMLIFYCVYVHFPKIWNKIFDIKAELNKKNKEIAIPVIWITIFLFLFQNYLWLSKPVIRFQNLCNICCPAVGVLTQCHSL